MSVLHTIKKIASALWRNVCLPIWASVSRELNRTKPQKPWTDPSTDPIRHVFVLMLENRSFDQVLGSFKDKDKFSTLDGIDPDALRSNLDNAGRLYEQRPSTADRAPFDPDHECAGILAQLKDKHSGFVRNFQETHPTATEEELQAVMNFFPKGSLPAMHWLAENFTICDRWFSSVPGPTWTNRLFLLSGTSMGRVEMGSSENLIGFLGYNQRTIFDLLEAKHVPWRVYFHDFPQSWLLENQLKKNMVGNYYPMGDPSEGDSFEKDLKKEAGNFPRFCFIEPQYFEPGQNDDHPTSSAAAAQRLIARVYDAIRANEEVWNSSLLLVLYDEHGGFFDHVAPPETIAPAVPQGYPFADEGDKCEFKSLGVRVPALLVSPWVGQTVFHEQLDHTSLLKYVSKKWGLPALTTRVEASKDFELAFLGSPRELPPTPIPLPKVETRFEVSALSLPEESGHQRALRALCEKIEREKLVADEGRVQMQSMPGDTSHEMYQRSLNIADAIKAKASDEGGSPGPALQ